MECERGDDGGVNGGRGAGKVVSREHEPRRLAWRRAKVGEQRVKLRKRRIDREVVFERKEMVVVRVCCAQRSAT